MKKRSLASALIALLLLSGSFWSIPKPAYAYPVEDIVTEIQTGATHIIAIATKALQFATNNKEFALDPLAWMVSKMAIQTMTKSMVNWINSGFQGSPAFVTDLTSTLQQVSDRVAGSFLAKLASDPALRSPFQSQIAQSVGSKYYLSTSKDSFTQSHPYTLNKVTPDDTAFLGGDFSKGGISAFFSAVANPENNPLGAQRLGQEELSNQTETAKTVQKTELDWGNGFLSWRNCPSGGSSGSEATVQLGARDTSGSGCGPVQTPGSVIQSQINKTLGLTGDTLVTADEFNEIVSALMSQLTSNVLGGSGLSGVSSVSSGGNGFIDKATDPSQYNGAAGNISGNVSDAIASQTKDITQFQTNWQTIQSIAKTAQTALTSCVTGANDQNTALVTKTLSDAGAALTKATTALSLLQKVQTDATAAGSDATKTADVGIEFQNALHDPSMPSATDLAYAETESQDTKDNSAPSLYTQMKNIATSCSTILH